MKALRLLLRVSLAIAALVVAAVVGLWVYLPPMCGNGLVRSVPSPDGAKKIVVFERDCGATTGFSTHASVLPVGETLPNDSGNTFISDTNHGAAPSARGGGPKLDVVWRGSNAAEISYHPAVRVFKAEAKAAGVGFTYSATEHAAPQGTPADRPASAAPRQDGG